MSEEREDFDTSEPEEMEPAKLSDEQAAAAARDFLGTLEKPDEPEISSEEAKSVMRRAGAVAEAEPEVVAAPEPEPEPAAIAVPEPPKTEAATGREWHGIPTQSGDE